MVTMFAIQHVYILLFLLQQRRHFLNRSPVMSPSAENMSVVLVALKTKPQSSTRPTNPYSWNARVSLAPSCLTLFVSAALVFKFQTVLQLRLLLHSGPSLPHLVPELFFQHHTHSHTCAPSPIERSPWFLACSWMEGGQRQEAGSPKKSLGNAQKFAWGVYQREGYCLWILMH